MADDRSANDSDAHRRARRRRALDDVFGDVVPDVTQDESDESAETAVESGGRRRRADDRDAEIERDVPPHHV